MEYWYSWVFLYWCDFHYSWAVGCESCPFFVFSPFDPGWFFFLCCNCKFRLYEFLREVIISRD